MKPMFCIAAKGVVRDADTNTMSLHTILEDISAEGFPFLVQEAAVLATWRTEAADRKPIELQFQVLNNDLSLLKQSIVVPIDKPFSRTIIRLNGIVVKAPGELRFVFSRKDIEVLSYAVRVAAPKASAKV